MTHRRKRNRSEEDIYWRIKSVTVYCWSVSSLFSDHSSVSVSVSYNILFFLMKAHLLKGHSGFCCCCLFSIHDQSSSVFSLFYCHFKQTNWVELNAVYKGDLQIVSISLWLHCQVSNKNMHRLYGVESIHNHTHSQWQKIQTHKRFRRTPFIRTRQHQQILGVIPFVKL